MACKFIRYYNDHDKPVGYFSVDSVESFCIKTYGEGFSVRALNYSEETLYKASPNFPMRQDAEDYLYEIMRKINGINE